MIAALFTRDDPSVLWQGCGVNVEQRALRENNDYGCWKAAGLARRKVGGILGMRISGFQGCSQSEFRKWIKRGSGNIDLGGSGDIRMRQPMKCIVTTHER